MQQEPSYTRVVIVLCSDKQNYFVRIADSEDIGSYNL